MADEISITTGVRVNDATTNFAFNAGTKTVSFDQSGEGGGGPGKVEIGTSEETISFGDNGPGWVFMENLDQTNYVEVGFSTGVYGIRLLAQNGTAQFYLNSGATIYARANTASCSVTVVGVDA